MFRLGAAILAPLLLLVGLEALLRLADFGYPSHFFLSDQLNGQRIIHENQQFGWRFFPPVAARTPRPVVLPASKPAQTCRVFVFGESAAFGDPSPAFGLPRMLEVLLRNRYPKVNFEVVNVAMTAINSNVILPIAKECAGKDGDVWVVYMGNNEVVGPYGSGTVFGSQSAGLGLIRTSLRVNGTRVGQLLARVREGLLRKPSIQSSQVGLELFVDNQLRHDDPRMGRVYANFAQNLSDILETGIRAGAKIVVSTVASNLKDCAPFASLHRPSLADAERAEWDHSYQAGIQAEQAGNLPGALGAYAQAARIDDQWAELQFRQARVLWKTGNFSEALSHFVLARDYDALRVRADSRINDLIRQACSQRLKDGIAFLDGNGVIARQSPHSIPGEELLYEHVHLNFSGNYWLARAVADEITGTVKPHVLADQVVAEREWLSEEECSAQLGRNDWDQYQTLLVLRQRLEGPPFTRQLDHTGQYQRIQQESTRAGNSLTSQKIASCIQRCEHALTLSPNDWALHQKLAQMLGQSPNKALQTRAIAEWREVNRLVPHYPEAHYELGVLLDKAGQSGEAETHLRLALSLKRKCYPNAFNALGRLCAGQSRWAEALANYNQAIRLRPAFAEALVNSGEALNHLGRETEARACFEKAMLLSPKNAGAAAVNLGQILDQNGEVRAAISRYSGMLQADPNNAEAHYNLARCFAFLGRSAEARQHYAEAVRVQPDFAEAHAQLGTELVKAGNQAEGLQHLEEAVRLAPDSSSAHKNLGIALAKLQRFDEAAKQFDEAIRLDPSDATARTYLQAARRSVGGTR